MAVIYARWIREGRLTIDQVPKKWREAVEKLLEG